MLQYRDRYKGTISNTPGVSNDLTINAAYPAYQRFEASDNGLFFDIVIMDVNNQWEIRKGCQYTHSTNLLTRGTLVDSSNGSPIALTANALWAVTLIAERTIATTLTNSAQDESVYYNEATNTYTNQTAFSKLIKQYVKNGNGTTISKGEVVYVSGAVGTNILISKAKADTDLTSATTIGFAAQDFTVNGFGYIITEGVLTGLNTTAATVEGDPMWLSPTVAGGVLYGMANKPHAPDHMVYLGVVTRINAINGEIFIKCQNGYEISELHDVLITTPIQDDLLVYNGTTNIWENKSSISNLTVDDQTSFKEVASVFPSINPTLNLDFANSTVLDPRITFSRATTATYYDQFGVLTTAAINEPRLDYNPVTREAKGLLIEEQRTNLLTYSSEFENTAWTKIASTVTANASLSPGGTVTADKLIEDATSSNHRAILAAPIVITTGKSYTNSVYVKAGERNWFRLWGVDVNTYINVDLTEGTIGLVTASVGNYGCESAGNGWYRVWITTPSAIGTNGYSHLQIMQGNTTGAIYTGDGTSGIYIWGAQLEAGSFPTSYIPTTSATVTRAADNASMVGTNFSSWYNQSEGTVVTNYIQPIVAAGNYPSVIAFRPIGDAGSQTTIEVFATSSSNGLVRISGVDQASYAINTASNTPVKFGLTYKTNSFGFSCNGSIATDSLGDVPQSMDKMRIGQNTATSYLNGHIKRITYYPIRLSNSILQGLTA